MEAWQKPETVTSWIIIAAFFIIVLLTSIIFLVRSVFRKIVKAKLAEANIRLEHQQELLKTNIIIQEKERKRIAADLHDTLIGKLTLLHMKNQIGNNDLELDQLLKESIETARRISHDLSPPLLEFSTLPDLIEDLMGQWEKIVPLAYTSDVRTELDHPDDMKIQMIRIVQEVMTNTIKHANASLISVHFRQTPSWIALRIGDNGKGFKTDLKKKGIGLTNIETRMQYLKGHYHLKSTVGKGTSALFLINVNPESI